MKETAPTNAAGENGMVNVKSLVFEYLIHWPFILLFMVACMAGAWLYLRYQAPVYNVSATVLIKQGDRNRGVQALGDMQDLGMMSLANNFDNEIEVLQSIGLVEKVVRREGFYISYSDDAEFGYDYDLYGLTPVLVWMEPQEADRLAAPLSLAMECRPDGSVKAKAVFMEAGAEEEKHLEKTFKKLPAVFVTPVGTLSLSLASDSVAGWPEGGAAVTATIVPPALAAASCKSRISAEPTSEFTSIVRLGYNDTSVKRGEDFLNTLVEIYNQDANEDKNQAAIRTAQFIDERIAIIDQELGETENQLATYKQQAGLTDLSSDAQLALQGRSEYDKRKADNENQLRLIGFLKEYINNPANRYEVIPANVGLEDSHLSTVISRYNELLGERQRLLRVSDASNPAVVNLDITINTARSTMITTVESVEQGLLITRQDLDAEARKYRSRVSSAPQQERHLADITRQRSIKADLYLMLLQKREENAITLAATANNGRIVEPPAAVGMVSPNSKNIYMIAFIFGIVIPVGGIWTIRQLRFKIEGRADVEHLTDVAVVGDVPQLKQEEGIVVKENRNELNEEIFRNVRTNIQYMLEEGQNVIMFTSTISGEGKSFIASNLAASLAFMEKKTVIVGLDIRRPGLHRIFGLDRKKDGITQYLAASGHTDLLSLCQPTAVSPNLFVLPGGPVPPNPTELVARPALADAIKILKSHFDYVILDTAPIGVVTDTQLIARAADLCVYICRADYTRKSEYDLINDLKKEKRMPRICTLINGIDMDKRRNGYYYGYGKYGKYGKYGHGKKYGYGYGYGYGEENSPRSNKDL